MTPLNSILNISDILFGEVKNNLKNKVQMVQAEPHISRVQISNLKQDLNQYKIYHEYSKIVWSSSRMLSYLIES